MNSLLRRGEPKSLNINETSDQNQFAKLNDWPMSQMDTNLILMANELFVTWNVGIFISSFPKHQNIICNHNATNVFIFLLFFIFKQIWMCVSYIQGEAENTTKMIMIITVVQSQLIWLWHFQIYIVRGRVHTHDTEYILWKMIVLFNIITRAT